MLFSQNSTPRFNKNANEGMFRGDAKHIKQSILSSKISTNAHSSSFVNFTLNEDMQEKEQEED